MRGSESDSDVEEAEKEDGDDGDEGKHDICICLHTDICMYACECV